MFFLELFECVDSMYVLYVNTALIQFSVVMPDGALFDASQYAFFGKDVAEEVELGGLDDDKDYTPSFEFNEEEFFHNAEEVIFSIYVPHFLLFSNFMLLLCLKL
jgi:hypothetical protein